MGFWVLNTSQKRGLGQNLHDADSMTERLAKITDNLTFRGRKSQPHDTRLRAKKRPISEKGQRRTRFMRFVLVSAQQP